MMSSGGVCAVLDYEIDQMTDYVAEMAQRIVLPNSPVSPSFRKFVSGLLSSTRLPSTTILLGMNYLARRTNELNAIGQSPVGAKSGEGIVWRMLTIGLLLGSKFLDDNTFQNRSWSEVSGIPVAELNTLESEWLEASGYNLFVNLDESNDYNAWLASWADWRKTKNVARKATLDRLSAAPLAQIDTNVQRTRPYSQQYTTYNKTASLERPQSGFYNHSDYEPTPWANNYPTPQLTPPSAPDSAIATPEHMSATGGGPRFDWTVFQDNYARYQPQTHATYVPAPHVAAYHTPYAHYGHHTFGNAWEAVNGCGCGSCNPYSKQPHFMGHGGYGQQILA